VKYVQREQSELAQGRDLELGEREWKRRERKLKCEEKEK
jgi:hypothetical protein